MKNKVEIVRNIYLFGVSLTGIVMFLASVIKLVHYIIVIYFPSEKFNMGIDQNFYLKQDFIRSVVFIVIGLLLFLTHWYLIVKEKRLGKTENILYESNLGFFESIFFYALAYIGITIFSSSLAGIANGFYHVVYPPPEMDATGKIIKESSPYITRDIGQIIESSIGFVIGIITFLIGFLKTQLSLHKIETSP